MKTLLVRFIYYPTETEILKIGIGILDILVTAGLCSSKGDARRSISQRAIKLNDTVINSDKARLVMIDKEYLCLDRAPLQEILDSV